MKTNLCANFLIIKRVEAGLGVQFLFSGVLQIFWRWKLHASSPWHFLARCHAPVFVPLAHPKVPPTAKPCTYSITATTVHFSIHSSQSFLHRCEHSKSCKQGCRGLCGHGWTLLCLRRPPVSYYSYISI